MRFRILALLTASAVIAVPAIASADDASIGATAKTASFSGTITDPTSMYDLIGFFNDGTEVRGTTTCMQPYCDEHTLTVGPGEGAELNLDATSDAYNLDLEIIDPDGGVTEINNEGEPDHLGVVLEAIPGAWTIRVYGAPDLTSFDYTTDFTYRTAEEVAADNG